MRKSNYIFLAFIMTAIHSVSAQRCASMEYLTLQLQNDPGLAARRQQIEQMTDAYVNSNQVSGNRAVITIPVVVHVVYNTTAQNISTAQIQSQINTLNQDFRKLNADWTSTPSVWQSLVADYEIEFCLATRDPNGNSTTGIIRKQTSTTSFSTNDNVKRNANGGDDAWPASSYLNLWVCNLSGGTLGYAQFPGGAAATDGVVINYTAFGSTGTAASPYNKGRTATHEIGHWLNLYHIWGDDGSACTGSDNVGDTPNQGAQHFGCPTFPTVSCSNGPNGDMWMNYMDYTDDRCMYMFTAGQKARSLSLFATGGARAAILNSQGCQSIATPPVANFSANSTSSCTGVIKFTDLSTNSPTSWSWNFGDGTSSTAQSPTHTYTSNGTYTVVLTATNAFGNNVKTLTNYITIAKPAAPSANNQSRCGAGSFSLSTTSTNPIAWLDSAGNKISGANPFVTPVLNSTTTYWLQDTVGGALYHVGPATNAGSGGYLTSNWALVFNVATACNLQSIYVYANGAGNRTFELRNSGGTVLSSLTVNLPTGGSRVTLNFPLTPGTAYQLGLSSGSTINLYRNNAGAVYPYTDAGGYVSITGNTANNATSYYYYFYDWILEGAGCVSERRPVTATISNGLNASVTSVNASCGSSNGSATATVSGGTPAYGYTWSNGSTSSAITGLSAGTYTVTVSDVNLCSGTASVNIASQSDLVSAKSSANVSCFGGATGSASVAITSGTPSYSYAWSNGGNTNAISSLTAGNYFVTITDGNNCSRIDSFTITQPAQISLTVTDIDASCNGSSNGSATANATGGTSPFFFSWSTSQSGTNISSLSANTYSVTVLDGNSCSASASFTISEPVAITLNATHTDLMCPGGNNATANVIPSGGVGNFNYNWCNGNITHNASGLSAGTCSVTVTDDNGCTATTSVTIQEPTPLQLYTSGIAGVASVDSVLGGTAPYSYAWSTGATTPIVMNLETGTYSVTVTDNNNCSISEMVAVIASSISSVTAGASFTVYPNPTQANVILSVKSVKAFASYEVTDLIGQTILYGNVKDLKTTIDFSGLASGTYVISLKENNRIVGKQRMVKQY